jgi:hypothetical protein
MRVAIPTMNATKTVHHTDNVNAGTATCGITTANVSTTIENVTCKRCLARLAKDTKVNADAEERRNTNIQESVDFMAATGSTLTEIEAFITGQAPTMPIVASVASVAKGEVTAFEAKMLAGEEDEAMTKTIPTKTESATVLPDPPVVILLDVPKALKKAIKVVASKTVHALDICNSKTGTLCNIPGKTAVLDSEVTCKVCLAKLHGTKPTNTIPDEVKAARKSFKSFVARASYMAYLDTDCGTVDWSVTYTTMTGMMLAVTSEPGGMVLTADDHVVGTATDKASLINKIEELCWSCGEER